MANYTKLTDFAAKDALSSGNPAKIVKGTEIDDEFNAISTAVQSKSNTASPTFTGTPAAPTAAANTNTTQIATTAHVYAERTNTATLTNKTLTSPTINSPTITTPTMDLSGVTSSGDLSVANGGTGASTANGAVTNLLPSQSGQSGKYLSTDGTNTSWGDPTPTTAQVLSATAGASVGAVGTYALLRIRNTNLSPGGTVASSSNSRFANASGGESSLTSGTWRCMGTIYTGGTADDQVSLFLRIV